MMVLHKWRLQLRTKDVINIKITIVIEVMQNFFY